MRRRLFENATRHRQGHLARLLSLVGIIAVFLMQPAHGQQTCPCSIWTASTVPGAVANDAGAVELGMKFQADTNGFITGLRFYKYAQNTGTHVGNLWSTSGTLLGTLTFANETASGWQAAAFPSPVAVTANTTYVASYHTNTGFYAATNNGLTSAVDNAPLHALASGTSANGLYQYSAGSAFPTQTYQASNYWVDVVFTGNLPPDTTAPTVVSTTPVANATNVPPSTNMTVTFSEGLDPTTVNATNVSLRNAANTLVPATVSYSSGVATMTPTAVLANSSTFTATVKGGPTGVKDVAGNALVADFSWSFTTGVAGTCPCSIWTPSTTPGPVANDGSAVELGMKFRSDANGFITGLRYYKYAQNTGAHIGSLWSSTGTLLGTVTFSGESASGWQQALFTTPVAVTGNTTYVASYHTNTGFYAASNNGLTTAVDNTPLHALASGASGGNGLYQYSANSTFPTQTFSASNYWVDVVFTSGGGTDTTAPTVLSSTPPASASNVAISTTVTATFSEPVDPTTINGTNVSLRNAANVLVPASVAYNSGVATLTPTAPLANSTSYTATIKGGPTGVKDVAGNALATDVAWTFTTIAPATCPCSIWTMTTVPGPAANDTNSTEVGLKFRADSNGFITGLRFYKHAQNTGTHVGSLWTTAGTLLGSVTFTNETASGWQEAPFTTPVAINANTTYVASYHTNTGFYAVTNSAFNTTVDNFLLHALDTVTAGGNGVFLYSAASALPTQTFQASNYWVDVVFATTLGPDTTAPVVTMTAPANASTVQGSTVTVSATASDDRGVAGVQFKVDGANQGAEVTTAPYSIVWNTIPVVNGSHTVAAVARDAANNTTTSTVTVTVNNPDSTPPTVTMTAPTNNSTVGGATVTVSANAADNIAVAGVQFLLDGVALGAEDTVAPYSVVWNTIGATTGWHTLTARARDTANNLTTSAGFNAYVWNSTGITIDKVAFGDRTTSVTTVVTSAFTTTAPNEVLLAFVSGAAQSTGTNTIVNSITGGGLTWQLVVRTNVQRGTAEVWRAFAPAILTNATVTATLSNSTTSALTVVSFIGADATGTNGSGAIGATATANASTGAPTGSLTTTRAGSWVFGVGNDWDGANARTLGANQTMVHEYVATQTGDTYWSQRANTTTPTVGTNVTINDTAPTNHRWNLSLVELLPVAPDVAPPTVTSTSPANAATNVNVATIITATFNEPIDPTTINTTTVQLRNASNVLVPAAIGFDAAAKQAIVAPSTPMAYGATYNMTIAAGVKDVLGNAMTAPVTWSFTTASAVTSPTNGPGGPILIVSNPANLFARYYAEILRAEGLNAFNVADLSTVTATVLSNYDAVILGEQTLTTTQVTMFTTWVNGGGNLIAMRPDKKLASLLGLTDQGSTLSNGYLSIQTLSGPGLGLVNQTIQFHGTADAYLPAPATVVATLYSSAAVSTAFPAVTLNTVGSGQAAAFTYDLARSVVYTRQGNPAWVGQDRDGTAPIRTDDLFFGPRTGDVQPDWIDLNKVAIPQADEQQRLLANLILIMNQDRKPMPRFWYFPRGKKAVVIMTGDDHATGGTLGRMNQYITLSPAGCSVDNWECVRSTSNIYPGTQISNATVGGAIANGFEVSIHVTLDPATQFGCGSNFTAATLPTFYTTQLAQFAANFPSAPAPVSHRLHCLTWSDWLTQPTVELSKGIRFDTNFYYWPGAWIANRPGMFTGSGMPMRFAGLDGAMVDVYQATTQMTDESDQQYPFTIDTLLDNAVGSSGYYGAFTANMHTDSVTSAGSDAIVASAQARGVPIVSAKQMLTWVDGRNNSVFGPMAFAGNALTFSVAPASGANGLQVMVPVKHGALNLTSVTLNGVPVVYTTQTIKGLGYAFITAAPGQYRATYTP